MSEEMNAVRDTAFKAESGQHILFDAQTFHSRQ